ncbi:hypothetical protein F4780DRAFT_272396 [Xylariomycetidae sp. FL0641]|nr:hypothetical protein F4780DRAFT_272396 [Xylariomycetidae sp. FL0641]
MDRNGDLSPQPDEYARAAGLFTESRVDPFSFVLPHVQGLALLGRNVQSNGLVSDSSLTQLRIPKLAVRPEQLNAPKETHDLIDQALRRHDEDGVLSLPQCSRGAVDLASIKLEPPLLRTDPSYDCRELNRAIRNRRAAHLDASVFPSDRLDPDKDAGLDFPSSARVFKEKWEDAIRGEKLNMQRSALHSLARSLQDDWSEEDQFRVIQDALPQRSILRSLHVTPPLSPRPQNEGYYMPDPAACEVPLASDPISLLEDDLQAAEHLLFQHDRFNCETLSPQIETPQLSPLGDAPPLSSPRPKIENVHVEVPLSPTDFQPCCFDSVLDEPGLANNMDLDGVMNDEQQSILRPSASPLNDDDIQSDDFLETLKESSTAVMRRLEQEQLVAADALARVDVPIMDFSIPKPDWQQLPMDSTKHLQWILESIDSSSFPKWPKGSKEEAQLRWSPINPDNYCPVSTVESIDDGGAAARLLKSMELENVPTSADYVWKQEGWAILREPEDEEEEEDIQVATVSQKRADLMALVRKRRLDLDDEILDPVNVEDSPSPIELVGFPLDAPPDTPQASQEKVPNAPSMLVGINNTSATSTLLTNFLDFHTAKRRKQERSSFFSKPAPPERSSSTAKHTKPSQTVGLTKAARPDDKPEQPQLVAANAPCPELRISPTPTKIIKSLNLSRGLFTRLERLYPQVEIIERDFDRWNSVAWDRHSVSRSPITSPLAAEADIIASPATGLIVTTLLEAMQKPLPGHKGPSPLRARVRDTARRYERLVVLVWEGNLADETARDLLPSECMAYAEFVGFVAGLGDTADTQVVYVGGGEATLAAWTVDILARHTQEAAGVDELLIHDETLWEMFLRRAGMNAYAAQVVLGQLKAPDDGGKQGAAGDYGLPAFIKMSPEERVHLFRDLLGGERVLGRINRVLETKWNENPIVLGG